MSNEDFNTQWQLDATFFDGSIGSRTANEAHWHAVLGCKNEFKTKTSVSGKCEQRRTAQILERSQSLLQYYNNTPSLQDWYSTDRGSHTPVQDEGDEAYDGSGEGTAAPISWTRSHEHRNRQLSALIMNIETDAQAEWNQWTVDELEHFSRWTNGSWQQLQDVKQEQGATQWQDATRNFVFTDWRELGETFRAQGRAMMTAGENRRLFFFQGQAVFGRELRKLTQWIVW